MDPRYSRFSRRLSVLILSLILLIPVLIYVSPFLLEQPHYIVISKPSMVISLLSPTINREPGVVKIYYAGDEPFTGDGKELVGYVLVYFDEPDVRAIITTTLEKNRVVSIDFKCDIVRSRESWNKIVRELSLLNGGLRGSIKIPTLGVTLMLFDDEGYMYTYTWTFSAVQYNMSVNNNGTIQQRS